MTDVLLLSAADVHAVFDVGTAIESQRAAFTALGREEALLAPRSLLPSGDDVAFCYVSQLPGTGPVAKFGSVNPGNGERGLPSVSAMVTVLDETTGRPVAIIEGTSVTTLRTSAASAVAVDHLARTDASRLAIIGCGVQGQAHVRAIAAVRTLSEIRLYSRTAASATALAASLEKELGLSFNVAGSAQEAVEGADIVAACTTSEQPVVRGAWLSPGCTVISVGSFTPDHSEVDAEVLARAAAIVVDDVATAAEQAGPVVSALRDGDLAEADLLPLGRVTAGLATARRTPEDIIFFNSVGLGVQDTAAAARIVDLARTKRAGTVVDL
ncbi:ornithine cyclodeaminase family protein [Actinomadura rudentiformis]|uniref:Ornithine cyclodeaminase family protein n=1 Tax=Actinomadura rudentiformis TaxID=359158 RepID=A0A6H9Z483_9ACTN|nr:ornithine cyclodeaminase family protein [Actinomadura rudentiformis]KAB2348322.1 ornithine cyclodeaminase family protein [Actinomadura rudentiformis]